METAQSRLLPDVEVTGQLKFSGGLLFEGKFNGGQIEGDMLTVGQNSEVRAETIVNNLTIFGRVDGTVVVLERCQLKAGSELHGTLTTGRLAMEEGATVDGSMQVTQKRGAAPTTPA